MTFPIASRRRFAQTLAAAAAVAATLPSRPVWAQGKRTVPPPWPSTLAYRITRAGHDLGRQSMAFRGREGALEVEIATNVLISVGGMQVYEFAQTMRELWRDRRLVELHAKANDNGARHTIELMAAAGPGEAGARLTVDGQRSQVPAELASTSLWHPFMLRQRALVDSLHGDLLAFKVRDEGDVSLQVAEKDVVARHYTLSGDLKRRLWYAQDGDHLLRMAMVARDNSEVMFDLVR